MFVIIWSPQLRFVGLLENTLEIAMPITACTLLIYCRNLSHLLSICTLLYNTCDHLQISGPTWSGYMSLSLRGFCRNSFLTSSINWDMNIFWRLDFTHLWRLRELSCKKKYVIPLIELGTVEDKSLQSECSPSELVGPGYHLLFFVYFNFRLYELLAYSFCLENVAYFRS